MNDEDVLAVVAIAVTSGADAALADAIERGLPASMHIDSEEWAEALADAEANR